MNDQAWPALPYAEWAPTKKTLHMVTQMVGKARLALAPPQPEWLHACLYLDARGFTTGAIPYGTCVITILIDLRESAIVLDRDDGRRARVELGPARPVAAIWADFRDALAALDIEADMWDKPQELVEPSLFSLNVVDRTFDAPQARTFHRVLCAIDGAFEEFRSNFFGRTGVQFWWGSFDFCVLIFNGKHLPGPQHRGHIMRYDLDAEQMNAGFWVGDDGSPEAGFFAYIVPQPAGCDLAPIEPSHAGWQGPKNEWTMSYESVRTSDDPQKAIRDFLTSVYRFAITGGGWDADTQLYAKPVPFQRH
jgi:hypothetical protein